MRRSTFNSSSGLISAIGFLPMYGNTSLLKASRMSEAYPADHFFSLLLCHSRAISLKVLFNCVSRAIFSSRFASIGSIPPAIPLLASSRFARASANVTSGYTPSANSFSLPATRYLSRQYLPPLGLIRRYKPPPSASLKGLSLGLAASTCRAFSFTWGYLL